jgi:hypothetical protein
MKTNDIKKGTRVRMSNGWQGTMFDNAKGNTRMVRVEGIVTEIGSVYAHDIVAVMVNNMWEKVEHTEAQLRLKTSVDFMF